LTHASAGNSFFKNSSWRGSPWAWRQVLDEYPGLRLCFAHFGHLQGAEGASETLKCTSWAEGYLDLMQKHQHVYADISNSDAAHRDQKERDAFQIRFLYWLCARLSPQNGAGIKLARRLIYGSDWWMGMVTGDDNRFFDNIHDMIEHPMKPVCDALKRAGVDFQGDFFGENALRFLGIRDDEGRLRGHGNGQRLLSFQRNLSGPTPRWLQPSA
jgi:predicted TIM-barrel fold metal-dependent hydrolase